MKFSRSEFGTLTVMLAYSAFSLVRRSSWVTLPPKLVVRSRICSTRSAALSVSKLMEAVLITTVADFAFPSKDIELSAMKSEAPTSPIDWTGDS